MFTLGVLYPLSDVEPVNTGLPIVIKEVSIIDVVAGEVLEGQSILIRNRRISKVAAYDRLTLPKEVIEVDGKGKYAMPSLWDMHSHIYKISPMLR